MKKVSGTKEWAETNENIMKGCEHGCLYCFSCSNAARFKTKDPLDWTTEEVNEKARIKSFGKRKGTIMFPTTHDLTPDNMKYTVPFLKRMLEAGNDVLVVSKPHLKVIRALCDECDEYKEKILFRFTIGSADDAILKAWEPGAPSFHERFASLAYAYGRGFKTSVSMEPLLETDEDYVVSLVEWMTPMVTDAIWIGKMNRAEERLKRNRHWEDRTWGMCVELVHSQSDERIKALYERLKDHPKVKWKESIKEVVGLELATEAGLDI